MLLRESVSQLMVLADARRVDIGFEGSIAAVVSAPAAELRSVFDNLIDNALRYAPEGGVVDVKLHEVDGHAVVDVLDNGPGIPQAVIGRVFDRFFRVPGAVAGGSGLGLAIARTAAERARPAHRAAQSHWWAGADGARAPARAAGVAKACRHARHLRSKVSGKSVLLTRA